MLLNTFVATLAILGTSTVEKCAAERKSFQGYKLLTAQPKTGKDVEFLHSLEMNAVIEKYEFLTNVNFVQQEVEILVTPDYVSKLVQELKQNEIIFQITINNFGNLVEQSYASVGTDSPNDNIKSSDSNPITWDKFYNNAKLTEYLDYLNETYPKLVKNHIIGKSIENRDLRVVQIGRGHKAIWIDSAIHAREWITVTTSTWIMNELLSKYGKSGENTTTLLDKLSWYFLVLQNPDGYAYTHTHNRMYRKNRNLNNGHSCPGVDVNRNFKLGFGNFSSGNPCSETYYGERPLSEPESRHVMAFLVKHRGKFRAAISLHSKGQMWMYPWAYKYEAAPDHHYMDYMANVSVSALATVRGTKYVYGNIANVIYPAGGSQCDNYYNTGIIALSYGIELPGLSHVANASEILPIATETYVGIREIARHLIGPQYPWQTK